MQKELLDILICPFCGETLELANQDASADKIINGILYCPCGIYPVLLGIPILKKDLPENLLRNIKDGNWQDALITMLMEGLSDAFLLRAGRSIARFPVFSLIGRLIANSVKHRTEKPIAHIIQASDMEICVRDMFFKLAPYPEFGTYLYYKFTQPRHLVALSLVETLKSPHKPVLDLGCGVGHLTKALKMRSGSQLVVGVDQFFGLIYCAKKSVAPDAAYVCCSAENPLPFKENSFSYLYSFDVFHYIQAKKLCVEELKRIGGPKAIICIGSVRNSLVEHLHNTAFIPPRLFKRLMEPMPSRIISDDIVLGKYLQKTGPPLAESTDENQLEQAEFMTLVASHNTDVFRDYGQFDMWPHAQGMLGLNPLYIQDGAEGDHIRLQRVFPSDYYQKENVLCKQYLPESVRIPRGLYQDLQTGSVSSDNKGLKEFIEKFVVVGMPPRYTVRNG